jgi:hypothetical protein
MGDQFVAQLLLGGGSEFSRGTAANVSSSSTFIMLSIAFDGASM